MKNKKIIQALNKVNLNGEEKEKILNEVLSKKKKTKFTWNYTWKFVMVPFCFTCMFLIMMGFYQEEPNRPISYQPRTLSEESEKTDFCYQNICYQAVKTVKQLEDLTYIDRVLDGDKEVLIYEGKQENTIILKYENSYFLYQEIER